MPYAFCSLAGDAKSAEDAAVPIGADAQDEAWSSALVQRTDGFSRFHNHVCSQKPNIGPGDLVRVKNVWTSPDMMTGPDRFKLLLSK